MTTTSVGMRCPECSKQKTKTVKPFVQGDPTLTYVLIAVNVLAYFALTASGGSAVEGGGSVLADGAVSRGTVANGEVWRVLTAGFLHAGLFHLFFNMYALYILGTMLEPAIGRARFAAIYFVSLLAGSFGALLLQPTGYTVGASGAVFGLMVAAIIFLRQRGINPMESGLGVWLLLSLAITFAVPNISIGGHLGGLAGGALAAVILFELPQRVKVPRWAPLVMSAAIGAIAIAGAVVVSSA
jgi:membrane associated rhomboid family serine protease